MVMKDSLKAALADPYLGPVPFSSPVKAVPRPEIGSLYGC